MFLKAENYRHPAFMEAVRDLAPQAPGVAAWGLMTGVAMVNSGLSVVEAIAMTLFVYAGSSQLAALPLIVAGAPGWVILATGFCVNLRFMVFSLHLRKYLMHLPRLERMLHGYLTADMSYVMFTQRFPNPSDDPAEQLTQAASLAGNTFIVWGSWIVASLFGIFLANAIPTSWGLGFGGHLVFGGYLVLLGQHAHANFCGRCGRCHSHGCVQLAFEIQHHHGHWCGCCLEHEFGAFSKNA
jgi:predicted branched-subunit amino acid permease